MGPKVRARARAVVWRKERAAPLRPDDPSPRAHTPDELIRRSVEQLEAAVVDGYAAANRDENDHDIAAAGAADDGAGRSRVDPELGDLGQRSAVSAGAKRGGHLGAEVVEQRAGD